VDVCLAIKQRLEQIGREQRDLAMAAEVTESYVSQLLNRKKLPPASDRTDIYAKMERFLKLSNGELSKLADHQRKEEWKRHLGEAPKPLLKDVRELILKRCSADKRKEIGAIFARQPFGELEQLVTQKLLEVAKKIAKEELASEDWLRLVARLVGRSYEQMRVTVLEFLDTDVLHLSVENCDTFLDPLIESWDIDLTSFAMQIVLNRRLAPEAPKKKFEFVEKQSSEEEPGFKRFLQDAALRGDATEEEIGFLSRLRMNGKRPTPLYYYRELQNLRDPLHFRAPQTSGSKTRKASGVARRMQQDVRKRAVERRRKNRRESGKS
jgi:hypothetical protein